MTTDFLITAGGVTANAIFIFASETGAITGWNPAVPPSTPPPSRTAVVGFQATDGAVYTGLALANNGTANFLYAADFHNGKIDVLNGQFQQVTPGHGRVRTFTDPTCRTAMPRSTSRPIGGQLYVSYAKQDAEADDAVAGRGRGFVSVFDTNGNFLERLIAGGELNAPWGIVAGAGRLRRLRRGAAGRQLRRREDPRLRPATGELLARWRSPPASPLVIDGLWGLAFGNGVTAGDANTLYYAAGPEDETHGLFGKITANAEGTNPVSATLTTANSSSPAAATATW